MKKSYDVYLAGAMHGRTVGDVLDERDLAQRLCRLYGLTFYDPAYDEGLDKLPRNFVIDMRPNINRMKWYVKKDDTNLDRCKTLLVLTGDTSSSGTGWEMGRAYYKLRIPIFAVAPKMHHGYLVNFTTVKATVLAETTEKAISLIKTYLGRPLNAVSRPSS